MGSGSDFGSGSDVGSGCDCGSYCVSVQYLFRIIKREREKAFSEYVQIVSKGAAVQYCAM